MYFIVEHTEMYRNVEMKHEGFLGFFPQIETIL